MPKPDPKAVAQREKIKQLLQPAIDFCEDERLTYVNASGTFPGETNGVSEFQVSFAGYDAVIARIVDIILTESPGVAREYEIIIRKRLAIRRGN